MTKYESKITSIPCSANEVSAVLGNLSNLERVRALIPEDKVQELETAPDYIRFKVDGLGQKLCIRIVEREDGIIDPAKRTIKYGLENSPVEAYFWIQLIEKSPTDTRIRLTLGAEIPMMFKFLLSKYEPKIQEGLDQAADMLTQFPFKDWQA